MKTDEFGDRMKGIERIETSPRFDPDYPLYARIDGRGFSKFTRGMNRPFDERMSMAMIATTKRLVEATGAIIGYVQSDEISLLFHNRGDEKRQFIFDGKKQKVVSVLAGMATAYFMKAILDTPGFSHYVDRTPHFDARVFSMPSEIEAANAFLWREQDARKNAISMAAHDVFSHKKLHGKSGKEKLAMMAELHSEGLGPDFDSFPTYFRRGTFLRRFVAERYLTRQEWERIPEGKRPPEGQTFLRTTVEELDMPVFSKVTNRVGVIFNGDEPVVSDE